MTLNGLVEELNKLQNHELMEILLLLLALTGILLGKTKN